MQGAIENFFKCFDEAKRVYTNVDYNLTYTTYYRMQLSLNNKIVFDLRGNSTEMIFDTAASKLLSYLRSNA